MFRMSSGFRKESKRARAKQFGQEDAIHCGDASRVKFKASQRSGLVSTQLVSTFWLILENKRRLTLTKSPQIAYPRSCCSCWMAFLCRCFQCSHQAASITPFSWYVLVNDILLPMRLEFQIRTCGDGCPRPTSPPKNS